MFSAPCNRKKLPSKKKVYKCENCSKDFIRYNIKTRPQLFCSRKCFLHSDHHKKIQRKKMIDREWKGENNPSWKGNKVSYKGLHNWIKLRLGTAKNYKCDFCNGKSESKTMNWSNLDGKYTRNLKKWKPLCKKCHSQYDQKHFKIYGRVWTDEQKKKLSNSRIELFKNKNAQSFH